MTAAHRFLDINRRASNRFKVRKDAELYARYDAEVGDALQMLGPNSVVVDLGGGRTCSFAGQILKRDDLHLVAVDISREELDANVTVHETRVADVAVSIPFEKASADLIVSRTLLEHVNGVPEAVSNIKAALRPGAQTLHLIPCRYATFAMVARIVPFGIAKRVLHLLIPEAKGVVEFDVYYDHCHPSALEAVFKDAGFTDVEVTCTWDQSDYFKAFFPIFLVVYGYQRLAERLGLKVLASYAMVRARA